MNSVATLPRMNRSVLAGVAGAMLCQAVLLVIVGWRNRHLLNPDGVAYMLIASHYANGKFNLAVSGYWGPMLSWLMTPFLILIENPLYAARIAMGLSAVVFLLGCVAVFHSFQIHPAGIVLGAWIAAIVSVFWSVEEKVTPDLLMSGLICLAISRMVSPQWTQSRRTQFSTGVLYGAAYLAKPVAFPVAFGVSIGIGSLWVISRLSNLRIVMRSLAITFLGFVLVASPWIATLSLKYQGLVISTSAKIGHAIVGPPDVERYHPSLYDTPEAGRISSGEDPTSLPYQYWSPFESPKYFKHQLGLIVHNVGIVTDFLSGFDRFHLGLFAALFGLFVHTPWRENMAADRWRWASVPIACTSGIYLPVFASAQRYYYPAYPFLIVASIGIATWLTQNIRGRINLTRLIGIALVTLSFADNFRDAISQALAGLEDPPSVYAKEVATKLQALDIYGPIAGAGDCRRWGGAYVEYVAFFLEQPFHGCEESPTAARVKNSEAKIIMVHPPLPLTAELERDPAFKNLDGLLFKSKEEAAKFPWKLYQIVQNS